MVKAQERLLLALEGGGNVIIVIYGQGLIHSTGLYSRGKYLSPMVKGIPPTLAPSKLPTSPNQGKQEHTEHHRRTFVKVTTPRDRPPNTLRFS